MPLRKTLGHRNSAHDLHSANVSIFTNDTNVVGAVREPPLPNAYLRNSWLVCTLACAACLAVGYAMIGRWLVLLGVLTWLAWLGAYKWRLGSLPSAALAFSVSLAVAGLLAGVPSWLMILSATLALASWDVILWDRTLAGNAPANTVTLLEDSHYRSLVAALGLGLLAATTGQILRLRIPFWGMIFLVMLVLFSLERIWRALRV